MSLLAIELCLLFVFVPFASLMYREIYWLGYSLKKSKISGIIFDTNISMARKPHHNVYVVELDKKVWSDSNKFREANPHYKGMMACLYVGMTGQSPNVRYSKHKSGHRTKKGIKISSYYVEKYGKFLRPHLYAQFNPLTRTDAAQLEKDLANSLKKRGYAVWWN